MLDALGFLFIVVLPLVVVAGGLLTLFAVGALFDALDYPEQLKVRVEGAFNRPPRAPQPPKASHYYKPYWERP
jgi:hypothetical protein